MSIALLSTFFVLREQFRINEVLGTHGLASGTSISALPASAAARLSAAAVAGFHDTIWLLIALSAFGILWTLLLRAAPDPKSGKEGR